MVKPVVLFSRLVRAGKEVWSKIVWGAVWGHVSLCVFSYPPHTHCHGHQVRIKRLIAGGDCAQSVLDCLWTDPTADEINRSGAHFLTAWHMQRHAHAWFCLLCVSQLFIVLPWRSRSPYLIHRYTLQSACVCPQRTGKALCDGSLVCVPRIAL